MKLIIDIPEEEYKNICENGYIYDEDNEYIAKVIANGIPLEAIKTDVRRHKMHFYPSDYTFINTLIDKWINKGVNI